ncbi:4-(cytidine 5'-diphospho)-2-C-methyl-D-erythritol kinase [Microbacterium invictum]|uniref:4-diphosphocytidyl-2-C-methyl-D-erythritol kinase n=1 Tax=Microbacterium invictum TaxID=515415 RepID=A0AA40VLB0_9MICO|nr:4-(cytidine 5'-diphospho)-2-C-methyl-D-erythritol kinase [Microbacterium invictum]MBB4138647.1 4-diphosphocytidyl-2-C-methyl-D-erythritol kinase [Microbacterium invictum]
MSLAFAADRVHVRAPGKLNVFFDVGDVRPDGYHPVASVYQAVSLYEDVIATPADDFTVSVSGDVDLTGVPLDGTNLAVRAARLIAHATDSEMGVHLDIRKGVPVAGGMGGGSADAAAALLACNELWGAPLSTADLHDLAAELGADVPFALLGGTAVGTGRGDELAPALARGRIDWVLVTDSDGLSTPAVYGRLDELRAQADIAPARGTPAVDAAVLQALRAGDAASLAAVVHNDLQAAALALRPDLAVVLADGRDLGARGGLVSGSGPTVAFVADDPGHAAEVAASLIARGYEALAVHGPVPGARVIG